MYKIKIELAPTIDPNASCQKSNNHNNFARTVYDITESTSHLEPKIWDLIFKVLKQVPI